MAIWHFKLMLLPQQWAAANAHLISDYLTEGGWEPEDAWREFPGDSVPEDIIDKFMPRGKAWHDDQTVWGDGASDDIQLWREASTISELQLRIDVHNETADALERTVLIASQLDCCILVMEGATIIPPSVEELTQHMQKSTAMRFALDPYGTIASLPPIREPRYIEDES